MFYFCKNWTISCLYRLVFFFQLEVSVVFGLNNLIFEEMKTCTWKSRNYLTWEEGESHHRQELLWKFIHLRPNYIGCWESNIGKVRIYPLSWNSFQSYGFSRTVRWMFTSSIDLIRKSSLILILKCELVAVRPPELCPWKSLQPQLTSISKVHCGDRHLDAACPVSIPAACPSCVSSNPHLPLGNCQVKGAAQAGGKVRLQSGHGCVLGTEGGDPLLPENFSTHTLPFFL